MGAKRIKGLMKRTLPRIMWESDQHKGTECAEFEGQKGGRLKTKGKGNETLLTEEIL